MLPFFRDPERELYVREVAKRLRVSPTTASKHLDALRKQGLLRKRRRYHHTFFRANEESVLFKHKKIAHSIERLWRSGLIDFLIDEFFEPEAIVLFGSVRRGEDTPRSDIDILVIGPEKKEVDPESYEKKLGKEVQIFAHSRKDIERMKTTNKELLNAFVNGIVLHGYWGFFP